MKRINRWVALSLLFVLPLLTTSAKEKWARQRMSTFTVVSNSSERDIQRTAAQLELFRAIIAQLFPRSRVNSPVPTTILLFRNHDSFRPFKPKYKGKTRDEVGGYFLAGWDTNYIALTAEERGASPFEVIFHEYVHFIINNNMRNAPVWLNEGLAEYYSTFTVFGDGEKFRMGAPIGRHIMVLRNKSLLPLRTLLSTDRKSLQESEITKVGIFYAESWALVHYLLHGKKGKRHPQFINFITHLAAGKSLDESFQAAFEVDYKVIEDELRQYVSKFLFGVLEGRIPPALLEQSGKNQGSEALAEVEVEYYLGDLLLHSNRLDEAVPRLEKAHQLDEACA